MLGYNVDANAPANFTIQQQVGDIVFDQIML